MRQPTMQDWAERLWPGQPGLQRRWIEAVRIVRATNRGWLLERTVRRIA